ncbi:MAG TPA: hypothetical protein VMT88_07895 [Actinomycetes bacterium]|nr:hypothetical protein [Actinomycetes bacterium]
MAISKLSRVALTLSAAMPVGALLLSACSNEVENAMSEGCDGLRAMSESYAAGDRQAFDEAMDRGVSLGGAVEMAGDHDDQTLTDDSGVAFRGYKSLSLAAYEPPERNDGELVWRGKELRGWQREDLDRGLEACDGY